MRLQRQLSYAGVELVNRNCAFAKVFVRLLLQLLYARADLLEAGIEAVAAGAFRRYEMDRTVTGIP